MPIIEPRSAKHLDVCLDIKTGWYRFSVTSPKDVVVFTLADHRVPVFVEVTASYSKPAHAKLPTGNFTLQLIKSDEKAVVSIAHLIGADLISFFIQEFRSRLRAKQSFSRFIGQCLRAFSPGGGYGGTTDATAPMSSEGEIAPGPLSLARLANIQEGKSQSNSGTLGPFIFVDISPIGALSRASLERQTYSKFTTDPARKPDCDFILYAPEGTILSRNALEVLITPIVSAADNVKVVFADAIIGKTSTYVFEYDSLLHRHAKMLSPIVLVSRAVSELGGNLDKCNSNEIKRISTPLACVPPCAAPTHSPPIKEKRLPFNFGITAIVPTRDQPTLLRQICSGLLDNTIGVKQLIIIDNGSVEAETMKLFDALKRRGVLIVRDEGSFNFSRLCNLGAQHATENVLAFINNDIKVIRPDWLINMADWAVKPDVGAVGTRLLFEDGSLQHAGISLGYFGHCGHMFRHSPRSIWSQIPSLVNPGFRSAVTAAAMVVGASKFSAVNGFDSQNFPVTFNDVDLCLKLQAAGFACVYEPNGEAFHLESKSRGADTSPSNYDRRQVEVRLFLENWQHALKSERWSSPNLSKIYENIRIL